MAIKDISAFFAKVGQTKSLQTKLKTAQKQLSVEADKKSAAAVVKIAEAAGFKFTAQDLMKARKKGAGRPAAAEATEVTGQYSCPWGFDTGAYCYY
jgi:predicted ribosomally synthesized peptide with nif11-like leader